ncbi:Curved DNA-binding protein [Rubripirellula lacrimiformis]|uniref:Curved DNA-binding protein n=1 Tax=Rubripirellula lacrimiformis TaxID=1930273 RepID=A0A517N651_9BACT|nr:J domain-containing protein [Rubripirellula lacrimiformis]QDT02488.1 Curved DNA-binding protein [Rubripirellula lacrimiformis]
MPSKDYVDHYEILEVSPNASMATVERVFRYLAKKHHPDVSDSNDVVYFTQLVEAFDTLRDPQRRAAFDAAYEQRKCDNGELVQTANASSSDHMQRYELLSLLYAQRKRDFKKPGIGLGTIETLVSFPPDAVNFHLWYFREKGWVKREESGQISISAMGVDEVDSMNMESASQTPRLGHRPVRLPSVDMASPTSAANATA